MVRFGGIEGPIADKTYAGFLNTPDQIITAMKYSARWNRLAYELIGSFDYRQAVLRVERRFERYPGEDPALVHRAQCRDAITG